VKRSCRVHQRQVDERTDALAMSRRTSPRWRGVTTSSQQAFAENALAQRLSFANANSVYGAGKRRREPAEFDASTSVLSSMTKIAAHRRRSWSRARQRPQRPTLSAGTTNAVHGSP
jgi:hypothetical protein